MLLLSNYFLWNLSFFSLISYLTFILSTILYTLPILKTLIHSKKNKINFEYITGFDLYWIFFTFIFIFFLINFFWSGPIVSSWFGHIFFSPFQNKIFYLIILIFLSIIFVYSTIFYFSCREIFDYIIIIFSFFYWILFLFFSNSLITFIFFIEILSTLIFLLIVTSTFSTTYYYNNLNLNLHSYFNNTTPFFFSQMLLTFFWISLISSLNLFFFLILFYIKFFTLDWYFFEYIFIYLTFTASNKDFFFFLFIWLNFLFCVFLKCGLVPFYFWKPIFFKGLPIHSLFFYITFFYFFIFLFLIYLLTINLGEIFFFFLNINIFLFLIGFAFLLFILCEAYYIKTFLALSSILNTLFVFLTLLSNQQIDFFFY